MSQEEIVTIAEGSANANVYTAAEWDEIRGWRHHRWLMTISDSPAEDPPRLRHDPVVWMQDTLAIAMLTGGAVLLALFCFILAQF